VKPRLNPSRRKGQPPHYFGDVDEYHPKWWQRKSRDELMKRGREEYDKAIASASEGEYEKAPRRADLGSQSHRGAQISARISSHAAVCKRRRRRTHRVHSREPRDLAARPDRPDGDEALARPSGITTADDDRVRPVPAFGRRPAASGQRRGRQCARRASWSVESGCVVAASSGRFGSLLVSVARRGNDCGEPTAAVAGT
jgi:hypothetical protein